MTLKLPCFVICAHSKHDSTENEDFITLCAYLFKYHILDSSKTSIYYYFKLTMNSF